jgi:hypothetical protein
MRKLPRPSTLAPLLCLLGAFTATPPAAAQRMAVPVEVQIPLMLKILSFDRVRTARRDQTLVVGVLHQRGYRESAVVADEVVRVLLAARDPGWLVSVIPIDLDNTVDLGEVLTRARIDVLYVTPLRRVSLRQIIAASRTRHVTTLSGVPAYVGSGIAVGIDLLEDRPKILVNLEASRAEGAQLSAELLQLARLVEGP